MTKLEGLESSLEKSEEWRPRNTRIGGDDVAVSNLLNRLSRQKELPRDDRGNGRDPRSREEKRSQQHINDVNMSDTNAGMVEGLKSMSCNMKERALEQLEKYKQVVDWMLPAGLKKRAAPHLLARLHRRGFPALHELELWMERKGMERSSVAPEIRLSGRSIDYLMGGPAVEAVNSYTMEALCRRLYGIEKALELVECEKHWRQPRGEGGREMEEPCALEVGRAVRRGRA